MDVLEGDQITKKYGDLKALDQISFSVREGEIFGFLGPNGADKTTWCRLPDCRHFDPRRPFYRGVG